MALPKVFVRVHQCRVRGIYGSERRTKFHTIILRSLSEYLAGTISRLKRSQRVRSYLKAISKSTWELVSWLTQERNVTAFDAHLAIDATENVLQALGGALLRYGRNILDRCPNCGSYRVTTQFDPRARSYLLVCKTGWRRPNDPSETDTAVRAKGTELATQ